MLFTPLLCIQLSYLEVDEAEPANTKHLSILREIKIYGNRSPGKNAVPGFKSGGTPKVNHLSSIHCFSSLHTHHFQKQGFKSLYKIRISESDIYILHGTLQGFKDAFAHKSAQVNSTVPLQLRIVGIDKLPPLKLKVTH